MIESAILLVLFVALLAYTLTGGADFGVGIVELFARGEAKKKIRKQSEKAIAPIWEANHVWIVLILVVLFVGFPKVHTQIVTSMHIPLLIMLTGIVLRGTAFTFRYYDLADDQSSENLWSAIFRGSSLLVPIAFGAISVGLHSQKIPQSPQNAWDAYLAPWSSPLALSAGFFTATLFAWLATVFLGSELIGKTEQKWWLRRSKLYGVAMVLAGALTSLIALSSNQLSASSLLSPIAMASVAVASTGLLASYKFLATHPWLARIGAGATTTGILAGFWLVPYPLAIVGKQWSLSWHEAAAPQASMNSLALALVLGILLIGPGFFYLYRIFKRAEGRGD